LKTLYLNTIPQQLICKWFAIYSH